MYCDIFFRFFGQEPPWLHIFLRKLGYDVSLYKNYLYKFAIYITITNNEEKIDCGKTVLYNTNYGYIYIFRGTSIILNLRR